MIHPPALVELHRRAAAGVTSAQLELGMRYVTGNGIPPDAPTALRWIGKAAAQVNPTAQFELGSYDTRALPLPKHTGAVLHRLSRRYRGAGDGTRISALGLKRTWTVVGILSTRVTTCLASAGS